MRAPTDSYFAEAVGVACASAGNAVIRAGAGLLAALALSGCMAGASYEPASPPPAPWWQSLKDPELSLLIERGQAGEQMPLPGQSHGSLSADIARHYVDLRAQQTALVLLAAREDLDAQVVTIARQGHAWGTAPVQAALAQLAATRAAQAKRRVDIAALRDALARLTGSPLGILEAMPDGAIPLPPADPAAKVAAPMLARRGDIEIAQHKLIGALRGARRGRDAALAAYDEAIMAALLDAQDTLARYGAARVAADQAQAQALDARASATLQGLSTRARTTPAGDAISAQRQALAALQAEEQARAAMTQAYVALAEALTRDGDPAGAR